MNTHITGQQAFYFVGLDVPLSAVSAAEEAQGAAGSHDGPQSRDVRLPAAATGPEGPHHQPGRLPGWRQVGHLTQLQDFPGAQGQHHQQQQAACGESVSLHSLSALHFHRWLHLNNQCG